MPREIHGVEIEWWSEGPGWQVELVFPQDIRWNGGWVLRVWDQAQGWRSIPMEHIRHWWPQVDSSQQRA